MVTQGTKASMGHNVIAATAMWGVPWVAALPHNDWETTICAIGCSEVGVRQSLWEYLPAAYTMG